MGSLAQYTDLYDANKDVINAHSTSILNERRECARQYLEGKNLPTTNDEDYRKTSIDAMFAHDYGVNINKVNIPVDAASSFRCDIPNLSTLMAFVINDMFVPLANLHSKLSDGVIVDSLANAAKLHPELVARYYGTVAPKENVGVALNSMLVQDGVFIYIPKGVVVEKTIQIVNIFNAPVDLMAVRRMLIVVEDDAQAKILVCDHTQDLQNKYLSSQIIEIVVGKDARLDFYDVEKSTLKTSRYSQTYVNQGEKSDVLIDGITLSGGNTRNNYIININGEYSETRLAGMAIGMLDQHTDNSSNINHNVAHCHSTQLFKYVLDDEATGAFEGSILVSPDAPYTEAYQNNRNILASTSARMHTRPQLIIHNDEVKCSHGATTGQLDAQALFYMRTRGVSEKEARTMLMQAFMSDVIDTVRMDGLRDRLRYLVEKRFNGRQNICSECDVACRETK